VIVIVRDALKMSWLPGRLEPGEGCYSFKYDPEVLQWNKLGKSLETIHLFIGNDLDSNFYAEPDLTTSSRAAHAFSTGANPESPRYNG
jgi:hypothetical protein